METLHFPSQCAYERNICKFLWDRFNKMFEGGDIKKPTVNPQGFNLVRRTVFAGDHVDTETRNEGDDKQDIWT